MKPCDLKYAGKCLVTLRVCEATRCKLSPVRSSKGVLKREKERQEASS